jgi:hypothetical protein
MADISVEALAGLPVPSVGPVIAPSPPRPSDVPPTAHLPDGFYVVPADATPMGPQISSTLSVVWLPRSASPDASTGFVERYATGSDWREGTDLLSERLAQSQPTVSGATVVREFMVETAEHQIARGWRLRRRGLISVSEYKTGELRGCLEVALAREAAGSGGQSDY